MFTFPVAHFGGAGYEIDQSIRFDSVRNSDLTKTLSGDGNLKTGTFSFWMKRSGLGSLQEIFTTYSIRSSFFFQSNDTLSMQIYNGASYTTLTTTAVFRDPSAFAHYLFRWDTTQSTDTDRLQFYYNGVLQTVTGAYPAQNSTTTFSDATYTHVISGDGSANTLYEIDGYLAEIHYVGTALAATDFGETNDDGVWIPIEASPTYGTNGFYLTGATAGDLGEDFSGNNNDFSSSGLSSADSVSDSPSLNHCTLNPLITPATMTLTDGNLALAGYASSTSAYGTFGLSSGKWFWQIVAQANAMAGIAATPNGSQYPGQAADSYSMDLTNGTKYNGGSSASYGSGEISAGDVIGVGFDADAGTLKFFDSDGNDIGTAYSSLTSGPYFPVFRNGNSANISINFGQTGAFTFTPSGYNALNTSNIATPSVTDPSLYFQPTLYEGNGSTQSINQTGNSTFQPDFAWIKNRDAADAHALFDAVRGATKVLSSNATTAEDTNADTLTAFESDGFALGDDVIVNTNNESYVGWQWKANGSGSSNEDGSINTTATSANTTAGFSISTYTGNGTAGATVGHGLGVVPKMILIKSRDSAEGWYVYHEATGNTKVTILNTTSAAVSDGAWNNTTPTSSVFTLGTSNPVNRNADDFVAYCFAEIPGYSSIGSYTGNGNASGPFIFTNGMKPAFVLIKRTNATENWLIMDSTRYPNNPANNPIFANTSNADANGGRPTDFLSNGFKPRNTLAEMNASGSSYIFAAWAEVPFGGADIAPATAR